MWTCPKCHEELEDQFQLCWNCNTAREAENSSPYRTASPIEEERAEPDVWRCGFCGSEDHIPSARIVDSSGQYGTRGDLHVEVHANPDALVFKGTRTGKLRANICGECGRAEIFAVNPRELYLAYRKSLGETEADQ